MIIILTRSRSRFEIQASFDLLRITIIMTVEHDEENKTRQNIKYLSNYVTRLYGNQLALLISLKQNNFVKYCLVFNFKILFFKLPRLRKSDNAQSSIHTTQIKYT